MFPAATGHEVAAPAVGKLVGNDVDVLPVTADNGGRGKSEDGVLHAWLMLTGLAGS